MPKHVYISGPLSDMSEEKRAELRALYEWIGDLCTQAGLATHIPHQHSDPVQAASMSPTDVDALDRRQVLGAQLVIAYVSIPSHGVGIEIEIAQAAGIPVILIWDKELGPNRRVSRLVIGNPAVRTRIVFANREDLRRELKEAIREYAT